MALKRAIALLGAASLAAMLAVATPAHAGETTVRCGSDSGVTGVTTNNYQLLYVTGFSLGHCGKLGMKVNYVHVGGDSWTAWKYSSYGALTLRQETKNAVRSLHSTSVNNLLFYSFK